MSCNILSLVSFGLMNTKVLYSTLVETVYKVPIYNHVIEGSSYFSIIFLNFSIRYETSYGDELHKKKSL